MTLTAFLRDNPTPDEAADPRRDLGESLPLHRLPAHRPRRPDRGRDAGRQARLMPPPTFGRRVRRNEDARLLTGRAMFVDDVHLPGMLHVAFVRSMTSRTARLKSVSMFEPRARSRAWSPSTPPTISATTASRRRCW